MLLGLKKSNYESGPTRVICHKETALGSLGSLALWAMDIDFFSTKHHMYYAVIRAILNDNCNVPGKRTPSPGSHGLLLKGAAWLTIITQTGREKGRVGEQQEKKSFQSGWTDQPPWTPCCSGQAKVPVTSCLTPIMSAKFPEDNSCRCLQTSVSAHSIQECVPIPPSHEAAHLLSTDPRCWVQWS